MSYPLAVDIGGTFTDVVLRHDDGGLTIRNEHRYAMFDPQIGFAAPLIAPDMTFGIVERTLSDGTIETAPSDAADAAH